MAAIVQREYTQPMKYFLTAACLSLDGYVCQSFFELANSKFQNPSNQEGAERVVNGIRPFLEANLQDIQADPARGLVRDAPAGSANASKARDAALCRNFYLLKPFIVKSIAPDIGIPNLGDFKVGLVHLSCVYQLHPSVRRRGGKAAVKDWSYQEGAKIRQLLSNLQRVTRRTIHAKSTKTAILKRLFAVKMEWLTEESLAAVEAENPESGSDAEEPEALEDGVSDPEEEEEEEAQEESSETASIQPRNLEGDIPHPTEIAGEEELADLESNEEFAGPEDVPHPMEIVGEEGLAELESQEFAGPEDVPSPVDMVEGEGLAKLVSKDDRKPLVACAAELPAELRDLLLEDTKVIDANSVLPQQRQIKKAYKAECARKKAGFVWKVSFLHGQYLQHIRLQTTRFAAGW
ncbi:unnamed protein product [Symbiodinium sp. CCMP2592]|nr:unnamed protein product [Symbiodinium sp. CCMP2592]